MATITKAHGAALAMEQIGRNIEWLTFTFTANASGMDLTVVTADNDLEKLVEAVASASSVTIIGTPTTTTVTFGVEGLGLTTAQLDTLIEAANLGGDATATVVVASVNISGVTFA